MPSLTASIITEREKAAIRLHVYGHVNDWRLLYTMAGGEGPGSKTALATYVSRWKKSPKVENELEAQRRELFADQEAQREQIRREIQEENKQRNKATAESEEKKGKESGPVDYTDPANQRRKLNELVNEAQDPGEALDALKVIIAGQRDDRQAAREGKQVRAYLPILCANCPLYRAQAEKQRRKAAKT